MNKKEKSWKNWPANWPKEITITTKEKEVMILKPNYPEKGGTTTVYKI